MAAIANSFIQHTHYSSKAWQPLKEFRLELAKGLVGEYHSKERHNRHHAPPTKLSILHFQSKVSNDTTGIAICSCCWFYFNNKRLQQRRDTTWYCHECQLYFCHTGVPETDFLPTVSHEVTLWTRSIQLHPTLYMYKLI